MRHQMSTTTVRDDYVLNCTCTPTGTLFVGTKEDCARNMVQHQAQAQRERMAARRHDAEPAPASPSQCRVCGLSVRNPVHRAERQR